MDNKGREAHATPEGSFTFVPDHDELPTRRNFANVLGSIQRDHIIGTNHREGQETIVGTFREKSITGSWA